MKDKILQAITRESSLEKLLDIDALEEQDWLWINRELFLSMCYNLKLDEEMTEEELEEGLRLIEDREIFQILKESFKKRNYFPMNQFQFSCLETGFKPTKDIETLIFLKDGYYKKLAIRLFNRYQWILKAMALDTYLKMGLQYGNLKEVYSELYEGNGRIIEDLLEIGEYSYLAGTWKYMMQTDELYFYKQGKFFNSWTEGEVTSKFNEHIRRD